MAFNSDESIALYSLTNKEVYLTTKLFEEMNKGPMGHCLFKIGAILIRTVLTRHVSKNIP